MTCRDLRSVRLWFPLLLLPLPLAAQLHVRLSPETERAFDEYVKAAEMKMDWRARLQPVPKSVTVVPGGAKSAVDVKDGIIHDWVAATLAPGATVEQALAVLRSYADYKNIYPPDVTDSRLIHAEGNRSHIYLQLFKKKVLSVLFNSEYDVDHAALGGGRWSVVSRSTKVAEVDDGRELPVGTGHGFVWRINVYWLLEPRPDGAYLQCRAITLSRDVPVGLGWVIKPMINSVPRESLETTLEATLRAIH